MGVGLTGQIVIGLIAGAVLGAEDLLRAVDRELLDLVHHLAAAVVALARIALGVLVGQDRALRLANRARDPVLGRDQLDVVFLALPFAGDRRRQFGVVAVYRHRT